VKAAPQKPQSTLSASATTTQAKAPQWAVRDIGKTCGICNKEVKERPLFSGSFIGCMC
jgi:hypothetical protein